MSIDLNDCAKKLSETQTLSELQICFSRILRKFGITTFALTYYTYHPNSISVLKYDYATADYLPWHKYYLSQDFQTSDSTLAECYQSVLPVFWEIKQQHKEAKTFKEKQLRVDSMRTDIEKGLCIPLHGAYDDFAVLLLLQKKTQNCLENWQSLQYIYQALGYIYFDCIQKLLPKELGNALLSQRELECLTYVAKHWDIVDIAKKMGITERTVNFHIQNINKKLGTKNKHSSASRALELGLIKL